MTQHPIRLFTALLALALSAACSSSPTSPTTTTSNTTTATVTTEVFTGTVSTPVDGVRQSTTHSFTVSTASSSVAVTLTSAIETFPDGTLLTAVTMGVSLGSWADNTCTPLSGAFTTAQGGSAAQISGTLSTAGPYCVQISDITSQVGPVAYAVAVSHY